MTDIDIDFFDRSAALEVIPHVIASRIENGQVRPHSTGIYVTDIPTDYTTNQSTIDYKDAAARGYFKIDFLNVSIYKGIRDEAHLEELMNTEPIWNLLEQEEFVDLLFHIKGYSYITKQMKPTSIAQLAAVLAMIRPAKRHLIGKDWQTVLAEAWIKPDDDAYFFKRSHSFAYAVAIVVQMNLICEQLLEAQ